jgi:hypothetical protein
LFVANSSGKKRKGKIALGERDDEFRFPLANFLRTSNNCIANEIAAVLRSGVFEGEILAQKCQLQPSRKNFEVNDAILGLCLAIEVWYNKFGKAIFNDVQEKRTETRYQELGQRSLKAIAGLIDNDPKFSELIKSFKVGSIGSGHIDPDAKVDGRQKKKSKSIQGRKAGDDSKPSKRKKKRNPKRENKNHHPLTVSGPDGKKRTRVYNNSLGIQLSHEPLKASTALWDFNTREGILILNTRHPFWDICDINDTVLMQYQEFLIMQAFNLELMPDEWQDSNRMYAEEITQSFVFMLLNADKLSGRRKNKKEIVKVKAVA